MKRLNNVTTNTYQYRDNYYIDIVTFGNIRLTYLYDITKPIKYGLFSSSINGSEDSFLKTIEDEIEQHIETLDSLNKEADYELCILK